MNVCRHYFTIIELVSHTIWIKYRSKPYFPNGFTSVGSAADIRPQQFWVRSWEESRSFRLRKPPFPLRRFMYLKWTSHCCTWHTGKKQQYVKLKLEWCVTRRLNQALYNVNICIYFVNVQRKFSCSIFWPQTIWRVAPGDRTRATLVRTRALTNEAAWQLLRQNPQGVVFRFFLIPGSNNLGVLFLVCMSVNSNLTCNVWLVQGTIFSNSGYIR